MAFIRRFLFLALFGAALAPAADEIRTVTLLHTNDLHARLTPLENGNGGFAYLASVLRRERANCTDCLLVNAGDLVQGTPVSTIFRGLPVYEIGNLLGFDAATLGNHDFDYGWRQARRFIETAKYPVTLSNVLDESGQPFGGRPFVTLQANGVRVAVVGAMTDEFDTLTTPALRGPVKEVPVLETVRRYAAEARARADVVVVLAHVTPAEEQALLGLSPDVPVVISGHAHDGLPAPVTAGGRVDVRVKAYTEEAGRLRLRVNLAKKSVESWDWERIPVDSRAVPPAQDVAAVVNQWEAKVREVVDQPLAVAEKPFTRPEVKLLIERAMREETGVDFAFMNAGGVRDALPEGRILARHVWNIMPFDNVIVIGTFKGRDLPAVVTKGRAVEPDREYTFAVCDFTAANQGAANQLGVTGLAFPKNGPLLRDLLIRWISAQKTLR